MHMHMFITEDIFNLRQHYLQLALNEEHVAPELIEQWLSFDNSFRQAIEKKTTDECITRCPGQRPIKAKKPASHLPLV